MVLGHMVTNETLQGFSKIPGIDTKVNSFLYGFDSEGHRMVMNRWQDYDKFDIQNFYLFCKYDPFELSGVRYRYAFAENMGLE